MNRSLDTRWGRSAPLRIACAAVIAGIACASLLCLCSSASAAIQRSGTLEAIVTDNFKTDQSTTRYSLRSGEKKTPLRPTELEADPGDRVVVTGEMSDGRLVGGVEATRSFAVGALAAPRKVAVLLVSFPDDPAEPWSPEETRANVFTGSNSARAFYKEESYGRISLTGKLNEAAGDVFGWIGLSGASTATCSYETWRAEANAKAAAKGIDLSGYDDVVYVFPTKSVCSWLGLAAVNGNWAMINGDLGVHPIAHELGHNLGLEHAGSMTCFEGGQRVQISDSCATNEYGDPFDVMGNIAPRHSSGWNLLKLGILGADNLESAEQSGVYSMRSAFEETDEPTILRVPRAKSGATVLSWYYLEIRKTGGLFENVTDASTTGVSIRIVQQGFPAETVLLDANPATSTFADAPLQQGQVFDAGSVRITTLSAGGGEATVSVALDEQPPTAPSNLVATPEIEGVKLHWGASTDNVGVDRYFVFRDGTEIGSAETTEFLDAHAPAGNHTYVVYAQDAFGNRSAASGSANATVSEFEGPICAGGKCKGTFRYSGAPTTWSVPAGVGEAEFTVEGARGGGLGANFGGRVEAPLAPPTTGEVVSVVVGGSGESIAAGGEGGYGGGGDGTFGAGGGGFSSVKFGSTLMLLAAGGGGEGSAGFNATSGQKPAGGRGSQGGSIGTDGHDGVALTANGATLSGGTGGSRGGEFGDPGPHGSGGAGGEATGSSACVGGATAGASGASGSAFTGGGGAPNAGGGGGGGYFGGGQGGGGASDTCGDTAGRGGGGGGSSFAAPGVKAEFAGGVNSGNGQVWISYPNPVTPDSLSYVTEQNRELVVPAAAGVLSGTPGPEGVPLEMTEIRPPAHGTVALADDGGFTYVPTAGFAGADSFAYSLADPSGDSATGEVKLRVARPPSVTIAASPDGDTYALEQAVPTSFSCGEGAGGTGLASCDDSGGVETSTGGAGHLDTSSLGIHTYTVTALSKTGLAGTGSISYLVVARQPPPPSLPAPPEASPRGAFSFAIDRHSLREVLGAGELTVAVTVNEGMSVTLAGKTVVDGRVRRAGATKPVPVFKKKAVGFAGPERKQVRLALTGKGRALLARVSAVRLAITGSAGGAPGEVAPQTVKLTLRR